LTQVDWLLQAIISQLYILAQQWQQGGKTCKQTRIYGFYCGAVVVVTAVATQQLGSSTEMVNQGENFERIASN